MAPKPPNVRTAPAEPWRFSGVVNVVRGPDMAPKPPNVRTAPAEPWRFSGVVNVVRGPDMAPKPPNVRTAPAEPWRFSGVVNVVRGPDMAPKPPDTRGAAGSPRCSSRPLVTTVGIVGVGLLGDAVASRLRAAGNAGQPIVQMSTISPSLTERLARETAAGGLVFLDCPISGTSGMVAKGEGVIFVGGDAAQYARWKPLLESILPKAVHVGRPGQAMVLKLVANLLVALNSAAAAEALNLARASGLDPQIVVDVLSTGAATSRMLEVRGPLMVRGQFP